jgi:hypothetical protein
VNRGHLATALVLAACSVLGACAGGAPERPPAASSPPASHAASYGYKTEDDTLAPAPEAPAPPPSSPAVTPASAEPQNAMERARSEPAEPAQRRAAAQAEWQRAAASLEVSASDCGLACRALASMERAVVHLCAIADAAEDRRRCEDARKQLFDARDQVRKGCGTCPGGPSTERGAPNPSR